MKAAVCERYGPAEVVVIKDVPTPSVGDGDVLIRVKATTVNIADVRIRAVRVPRGLAIPTRLAMGVLRPRNPIFGLEVAGTVERVGAKVRAFAPGDRVVASRGFNSGVTPSSWPFPRRAPSPQFQPGSPSPKPWRFCSAGSRR